MVTQEEIAHAIARLRAGFTSFDEWPAALMPLVKRAQAEALREAAAVAQDWVAADGMNGGEWFPSEWGSQAKGWLMHRADRIERGEDR